MSQHRQLAAIMFTDIVGYTALMGNNEQKAFELLRKNREIQKPVIEEFGGRWIKELGDGVMATFPAVSNAVYAAMKIQELCRQVNAFSLRIGIHQGEVVFENDDIFGDAVNIAARIQTAATPGGIFISESVHRDVSNKNDIRSEFVRLEILKNVKEPVGVYKILLGGEEILNVQEKPAALGSIVPGYDCDIHISYRFNDNKYDGWVTEFVEKLQQELSATIKDKLSIFFDKRPEENLPESPVQSLIFIPIISQTYCDTSSPVWKREFAPFLAQAKSDSIGPNIKLSNGNAVSRVIPVKIHDIDTDDVKLLESELSGIMRSIDFIYRDEGVNRPLRPLDDEKNTSPLRPMYRNQINKLANAVKEIISGIKLKQQGAPVINTTISATARQIVPNVVSTSLSPGIKVQVINRDRPNIYLAWTSSDLKESREEMAIILQKAGFNVLPAVDCPADDETFKQKTTEEIDKCVCSLHMLSGEFGRRFEADEEMSFPQYQFLAAKNKVDAPGSDFSVFVWQSPENSVAIKPAQQNFIKYIRNNITRNMMFSNSLGPMQLVDDIRVVMMKNDTKVYDSKDTDIFFIFNQQDEQEAQHIINTLSLEFPVETMNILPEGEDSYREMSSQQIPKSKLAVVYFKYAADWALPFIKQIWKQVGGASSPTPMFLVGEDDPYTNIARNFKAPKVISSIVPKESIPVEVKKVYNAVVEIK
ncbi:adenylate/guanylate cyclase domain-containing protein [Flavihumibacter profundi]|uniref:adenylate/guanylate cyclase domain-containing protein n=1 Tax=Flavihumibacter profundi TaxID=2716883 RepID=UPI001CC5A969|nr:adenylate/guanylate cyclase domain-containing protein [Flavihumibacter profundi]MBZ5858418.1 adenylate/guanylate cyclase domain-containing protein [Flavihumibacter profundi]